VSRAGRFAKPFRVNKRTIVPIGRRRSAETGDIKSKKAAVTWLERGVARLSDLQESSMPRIGGPCY